MLSKINAALSIRADCVCGSINRHIKAQIATMRAMRKVKDIALQNIEVL